MLTYDFKVLQMRRLLVVLFFVFYSAAYSLAEDNAGPQHKVNFERHIAPLLGRLGCNSAACHGAFGGGKAGLQLSLFGHSAKMDFLGLTDRLDSTEPESSPNLRPTWCFCDE